MPCAKCSNKSGDLNALMHSVCLPIMSYCAATIGFFLYLFATIASAKQWRSHLPHEPILPCLMYSRGALLDFEGTYREWQSVV